MNKKLVLYLMLISAPFIFPIQAVYSAIPQINAETEVNIDEDDKTYSEKDIIKRLSIKDKLQKTPEVQIRDFIKKYNRYSEQNKFDKLKELDTENFVNNDGFDRETLFKMIQTATTSYKNIKYTTDIKEIKVNGKYATVKAHETASAQSDKISEKIDDTGIVVSEIDYVDYLVKEGNKWKIQVSEIQSEEVSMKYGEAKNMKVEINVPLCVSAGAQYEADVWANTPDGSFALGSIVNERITYPQDNVKDIFRAIKSEKLSRVLTANNKNDNEYVTVSIALTRAEVEPTAININMTGAAFAMKRVNVVSFNKMDNNKDDNGKQK